MSFFLKIIVYDRFLSLLQLGKAWFIRKMSHKPVGGDVPGDPFWMNINAASYYIVQTHIRVPFAFPSGEGGCDVGADG